MDNQLIRKNIRAMRKLYKMTQTDLGKAIGTGKTHISGYEKGGEPVTKKQIAKIAKVFNISEKNLCMENFDQMEFAEIICVKDFWELYEKTFPYFETDDEDDYHKNALEKQWFFLSNLENWKEDDANEILRLYRKSWEEHKTIESTINAINFMITVCSLIDMKTIKEKNGRDYLLQETINVGMFAKEHILDKCYKTNLSWEKRKIFASKYIIDVEEYIDAQKNYKFSNEVNEIGDFLML